MHGPHVADVKNTTAALCVCSSPCSEDGFVHMWMGPATVELPGAGERGREVGADREPVEYACAATAWRSADASAGLGEADAACWSAFGEGAMGGVGAAPGTGRRNIASIVGRRAAPKGVERKSEGRSVRNVKS